MYVIFLGYDVKYYLGFFYNHVSAINLSILLTTTETHPVQYFIEAASVDYYHNGTVSASNDVILNLSTTLEVTSHNYQRGFTLQQVVTK